MGELRKNFGRIRRILDIPNLIDIQNDSYRKFLQEGIDPDKRGNYGLQGAFHSVFPISDFSGKCSLEFVSYKIGEVRYDMQECVQKGMTYAAPLKIVVRLVVFDTDRNIEPKPIRDIKEQEIYFGEIPLMTENGTFIVNGTERVIVSQLHRSPGIFFDHDKGKTLASGKLIYSARVIPIRGSWLDLEFDSKDLLYVTDRSPPEDAGDDPAEGDGQYHPAHPELFLQHGKDSAGKGPFLHGRQRFPGRGEGP